VRLVALSSKGQRIAETYGAEDAIYIGSREGCGLHIPDESIPPQVAVVLPEAGDVWALQPLDGGGGLQVNGVAVSERVQVRNADQLAIGDYVIRVYIDDASKAAARSMTVQQMARFLAAQLPQGSIIKKSDEPLTVLPGWLHRLGRVNVSLGSCNLVTELMNVALTALLEMFGAHRAWIGVRRVNYGAMEYVEGRHVTGSAAELPALAENLKPRVLDRGQFILVPLLSAEERMSILTGPLLGPEGQLGMVYLDTGDLIKRFDTSDLDLFLMLLNMLGAQLDAIFKGIAKNRAAMLDGEVAVSHAIQARVTPRKLPQWEGLQFGAFREPGRQRSSDVYDIVRMANQAAAVMIAHTSATGPLPAMVMAQAQATFRSGLMHGDAPHVFLRSLNVLLFDGLGDRLVDCFVGVIDPGGGLLRYATSGKMGAYVISARGEERKLSECVEAPPLGQVKNAVYELQSEEIGSGETIVLFTPGVVTARNSADEAFGEARFVNILCDGFGQLASSMLKEMLSDLQSFTQGGQQPEDITVILAHRV
jgi:Stage II sporulation protein E (SpoIIE)